MVGCILFSTGRGNLQGWFKYGRGAPRPAFYGLYDVEEFEQPGAKDPWNKLAFDTYGRVHVRTASGAMQRFPTTNDDKKQTLSLTRQDDGVKFTLVWSRPDAEHLQLQGTLDGTPLSMTLKKKDSQEWLLISRGFHWVNEFPFNR